MMNGKMMEDNELKKELKELQDIYSSQGKEEREALFADSKKRIEELSETLLKYKELKTNLEVQLKSTNKEIMNIKDQIRRAWEPFTMGSDEAVMDLGDYKVKMKNVLNVSVEDKDEVIDWLANNGYKDVMKWDIHHATMKKIATELFEDESKVSIPGLKYSNFNLVDVK